VKFKDASGGIKVVCQEGPIGGTVKTLWMGKKEMSKNEKDKRQEQNYENSIRH